ncbi:MAG TPA: hypothetical protein P5081_14525 [Phycisphaerae bacterium]|nr:hypothetical protein [Phycisphaerae bacterium]HRW54085.1 hypothetical protein [Phycisphaerae bacterium]
MRLEIEVPDTCAVISDYGAWNKIIDFAFDSFRGRTPLIVPDALSDSLFSVENATANAMDADEVELQACLSELRWRNVVAIRRYRIPNLDTMMSASYDPNALD